MKKVNKIAIFALALTIGLVSVMPAAEARSFRPFNGQPLLQEEISLNGDYAVNYGTITLEVPGNTYTVTMEELRTGTVEYVEGHYIDSAVVETLENLLPSVFTLREVQRYGGLSRVQMEMEDGFIMPGLFGRRNNKFIVGRAGAAGAGSCAGIGGILAGGKLKQGPNGTEVNNGATSFGLLLGCDWEAVGVTLTFHWTATEAQEVVETEMEFAEL